MTQLLMKNVQLTTNSDYGGGGGDYGDDDGDDVDGGDGDDGDTDLAGVGHDVGGGWCPPPRPLTFMYLYFAV